MLGVFQRDGKPLEPAVLEIMFQAMPGCRYTDGKTWLEGCAGGYPLHKAVFSELSIPILRNAFTPSSFVFFVLARLDNREELINNLNIPCHIQTDLSDAEIVRQAYCRWGEQCSGHIFGDWAFAAWHPEERRLFLSRDHLGNSAIYYYVDDRIFAFASSPKPLLALGLSPLELDELYLGQILTSWPAYQGERTIRSRIRRLPPAHSIRITPGLLETSCYWRLEEAPRVRLKRREDYVHAFLEHFDAAVRSRLRLSDGAAWTDGTIASMLSGGLDSGSVTATAALMLRKQGRKLTAFTSVPRWSSGMEVKNRFGDELPLASATAGLHDNVIHHSVTASDITPIRAIRRMLGIVSEPLHGAGNQYWTLALTDMARENGARLLLHGQSGNGGISWNGDPFSQSLFRRITHYGWRNQLKEQLKRAAPRSLLTQWRILRMKEDNWRGSAINPDFAKRLCLSELRLHDPDELYPCSPIEARARILRPGKSIAGAFFAMLNAETGLEHRDPTADPRLLAFCIATPDHIFIDPETGMDRWLIREAMRGRLPDAVRLNRKRGLQAFDLVARLRMSATEVEEALNETSAGPAAEYLNVSHMRLVWKRVLTEDSTDVFKLTNTVLLRGIMAGLFINSFFGISSSPYRD